MKRIFEIEWPEDASPLDPARYVEAILHAASQAHVRDITDRSVAPRRWLLLAYLTGAALANVSTPILWAGFAAFALALFIWHKLERR